jgi:hypothetical protein
MKKFNLGSTMSNLKSAAAKRSPEILLGFGIAGMITTTILAVKATPKALSLIEEEKQKQDTDELPPVEVVKVTWKCYIPAGVTCVVSLGCLIGSCSVSHRRNAMLATAYSLSEATFRDYKAKVIDAIGERKERTVRDAVAKEHLERDPVENKEVILVGSGTTLCYDSVSGRYFKSDMETIKKAENRLDARLRTEMYISLNEFYYEIGLEPLRVIGDDLGWNIDSGYLDITFSSQLATDGTPCLVIEYGVAPRYDYRTLM